MYIEEIILEGFKSYATRTVISNWDPEFNAITGLNGTGKSNILDAICFVLGIDNLRQVRATNLQDLVYKRGQAGITKASVTIVFNNSDSSKSPFGYADCPQITVTRQIVLNGKNKYLINGHNAQQKVVENLFQSVQLNVNNPHFLIMQGQITRVLNMKPPEILAMIEETAGTRMFEDRKTKAITTMEKKEKKVEEIASLLNDTIEPKLNSLRNERTEFLEFKRTEADLERWQRLLRAYDFYVNNQCRINSQEKIGELEEQIKALKSQNKDDKTEFEKVEDEILNVSKRREKELKASHKLKELEESCKEAAAVLVRLQTQLDFKKEAMNADIERVREFENKISREENLRSRIEPKFLSKEQNYNEMMRRFNSLKDDLKKEEDLLRSLETGLSTDKDSGSTGYFKLLTESRDRLASVQTSLQHSKTKESSLQSEITQMKDQVERAKVEMSHLTTNISKLTLEYTELEKEFNAKATELPNTTELYDQRKDLLSNQAQILDEIEMLQPSIVGAEFKYDPTHCNPQKIRGTVAKLMRFDESTKQYSTALEVTAGGRLYNVIVDDERTVAELLERGKLSKRVTFIPLNKIQSRRISTDKISLAKQLTSNQAVLALNLIEFDQELRPAMEYVFGSTFVCESKESAAIVAFDKRLGFRAVTLQGDIYEPSGTLSGGSISSTAGILEKLHKYQLLLKQESLIRTSLEEIQSKISTLESERRYRLDFERTLKSKQQEISSLQHQYELHSSGKLIEKHKRILDQLTLCQDEIKSLEADYSTLIEDCKRYEREMSELENDRDGKLAQLSNQISLLKNKTSKEEKSFEKVQKEYFYLKNEFDSYTSKIEGFKNRLLEAKKSIDENSIEIDSLREEIRKSMTVHNGMKVKLETEMQSLNAYSQELQALDIKKKELETSIESTSLEMRKAEDSLIKVERELQKSTSILDHLLLKYSWIKETQHMFGVPESPFDFSQHNMSEIGRLVKSLESSRESLRKTINFNVMDMIDRVEAKDNSLKQMLSTVKKDRTKIEGTISKLNDYMLDALHKTWTKVNLDFGQIFSELLPGGTARLDTVDDLPLTEGLEIKVCLGGVWKQSLTELSGGQRSLVALSLILSLLQFKPAPMYILDEVDAALDLSHTENIGNLLKTRFKGSQFIVVSLKEGMFNNANVLFRTRFRDGVSGVDRTENSNQNDNAKGSSKPAKHRAKIPVKKAVVSV